MNWGKAGGVTLLALGLISFVMMVIFGWDISIQILALQRQFFAENWYLLISSFTCFVFGIILIGESS